MNYKLSVQQKKQREAVSTEARGRLRANFDPETRETESWYHTYKHI